MSIVQFSQIPYRDEDFQIGDWKKYRDAGMLDSRHLPISALVRTEPCLRGEASQTSGPIQVVHYKGEYHIKDGHHRVAAALAAGKHTIDTEVLQYETDD